VTHNQGNNGGRHLIQRPVFTNVNQMQDPVLSNISPMQPIPDPMVPLSRRNFQGYEMSRIAAPPEHMPDIRGISEAREHHQTNMKDCLTRIIDDAIGIKLAFPAAM
jgi:hypothetical protein